MKRLLIIASITIFPLFGYSQFSVGYYQSGISAVGINYEIKDRFKPELKFGTNATFDDMYVEINCTYDILNKDQYEFYSGLGCFGFFGGVFNGLVIPIGLNVFPFSTRSFGFIMEIAPILSDVDFLRGSLGIRYRFLKD